MPLKRGTSKATIAQNIRELLDSYRSSGSIGTSTPSDPKAAQKQAVAIALNTARRSK